MAGVIKIRQMPHQQ